MRNPKGHSQEADDDAGSQDALSDGTSRARKPSLVQRRRRAEVEITDSTVDSLSGRDDGVHRDLPAGSTGIFNVVGIDEVSKEIRRTRAIKAAAITAVVAIIIIAIVLIAGSGASNPIVEEERAEEASSSLRDLDVIDLGGFYGLSLGEAEDLLAEGFALESTSEEADLEDSDVTYTKRVYVDTAEIDDEWGDCPTTVELLVDSNLVVQGAGYTVCMDREGIEAWDFEDMVSTPDALQATLEAAGVPDAEVTYSAPDPDTYTSYLDPTAEDPEVSRYSTTFTGDTGYPDGLPGTWTVTFTYDYISTDGDGTETVDAEPIRTVTISLS